MEINGEFKADLTALAMVPGKGSKTKVVNLRFTVKCDEEKAKRLFGDSIASLAFGSMREVGGGEGNPDSRTTVFGYVSINPGMTGVTHILDIDDHEGLTVEPKITGIKPAGEDSEEVHIEILTPVAVTAKICELMMKHQELVDLKFEPSQKDLPNVNVVSGRFGNPSNVVTG